MKVLFPTSTDFDFTKHEPGITYIPYEPREPIPEEHLDAEVLVAWLNSRRHLNAAAVSMPNLRLVQGLMAGADSLIKAGFPTGVPISNGRGLHDLTVAEHALALLLAAARRLHHLRDAQKQKRWLRQEDPEYPDHDINAFSTLRNSHITIWGFGSIAETLAPQLKTLGAKVTGVATRAGERAGFPVVATNSVDSLLPETDALVMILPESAETTDALDARRLELLPRHAWVVNVGRGNSINETDLAQALADGTIGGAALDVFLEEPLPENSPLWELPNLILSPHAAGNIPIGAEDLVRENVRRLQAGETLKSIIDRENGY